jgi:hypothetical protein
MTTKTEVLPHDGGFLISEANGFLSREEVTLVQVAAASVKAGSVMGLRDDGKYQQMDPASSEGNTAAAGVLLNEVDATAGDAKGVLIRRYAEVRDDDLVWLSTLSAGQKATGIAALLVLGIQTRVVGTTVSTQTD